MVMRGSFRKRWEGKSVPAGQFKEIDGQPVVVREVDELDLAK
jgi:hypothetical protein